LNADLYLDVISPYAYLYWRQRHRLDARVQVKPKLVLFGGLLKAWAHKGPAELPSKRLHTYAHCVWVAKQQQVPFVMPPRHPFNPLKVLRLLTARGTQEADLDRAFDWIWAQGNDPEIDFAGFTDCLGQRLDVAEGLISDPAVKAQLVEQTNAAFARGIWGVPTLDLNGHLFWGHDTIDWANAYAEDPQLMTEPSFIRAAACAPGITRA
jgi:2-hydroxychromene-2-carboxylate isomerase